MQSLFFGIKNIKVLKKLHGKNFKKREDKKMINLETILTDFEKISQELKSCNDKIKESDFVARLVICYENEDKAKNQDVYNELVRYTQQLDKINFSYKCKENKYFYLLNKNDFQNQADFEKLQNMFGKKDKTGNIKNFTINLKNFNRAKKFLDLVLQVLQSSR